jgi:integrase
VARPHNRLTARTADALQKPGRHADGGGLYLLVEADGAKRWVFIYQRHGRRREMGLGPFSDVRLADAREARNGARRQLARDLDPIDERRRVAEEKARVVPKFGPYAVAWVREQPFRNEKYRKQVERRLHRLCGPLMERRVDEITSREIVAILKPHWSRVPETAERVLGQIERVLNAAYMANHIPDPWSNPAAWRGRIEHLLPRVPREVRHHRAVPFQEIGGFMAEVRKRRSVAAAALEFAILTAARTSEVRFMTWAEIDLGEKRWICPAARMKMKREHRVPLSSAALAVLEAVTPPFEQEPGGLVFPRELGGRALSDGALERVLDRMKVAATVHGFRSTFRDWAGDCTEHDEAVVEAALAHSVGDETQRAYRRSDAFEKRRKLMNDWAEFCGRPSGSNVKPLFGDAAA